MQPRDGTTAGHDAGSGQVGRERGIRGLLSAWIDVLVRPRRFFGEAVTPGAQAPGLTFAVAVATTFTIGWIAADAAIVPDIAGSTTLSALVVVALVSALAAPVGLHLTAAVATLSLLVASIDYSDGWRLRDRGGVSETVQVVAYASAPLAVAGPPIPELRVLCGIYATVLLYVGIATVHKTSPWRTIVATLPPALIGYGVGFRTVEAGRSLFG